MGFVQGVIIVLVTSLLGVGSCFDLYGTAKYVFKKDNIKPGKSRHSLSEKWLEEIRSQKKKMAEQQGGIVEKGNIKTQPLATIQEEPDENGPLIKNRKSSTPKQAEEASKQVNTQVSSGKSPLKKTAIIEKEEMEGKAPNKNIAQAKSTLKKTEFGKEGHQPEAPSPKTIPPKKQKSPLKGKVSPPKPEIPQDNKWKPESSRRSPDMKTQPQKKIPKNPKERSDTPIKTPLQNTPALRKSPEKTKEKDVARDVVSDPKQLGKLMEIQNQPGPEVKKLGLLPTAESRPPRPVREKSSTAGGKKIK